MFGTMIAHQNTHQTDAPSTNPEPKLGKVKFRVAGREFTLRQRWAGKFAPWYLVGTINGKRFNHALGTNEAETAKQVAKVKFIQPALDKEWGIVDSNKKRRHWATVGELLDAWRGLELGITDGHQRAAANALANVLRRAGFAAPEEESADVLCGRTARRFFDAVNRECASLDQVTAASRKRSANSVFNQAKSVVQVAALARYRDAGLNVPEVVEFVTEGNAERFDKGLDLEQEPPGPELMAGVLAAWPGLEDWNEFAAVGLELAFGLRAGEVAQARWEWFTVRDGLHQLDAQATVKNGTGRLRVVALNPFWAQFEARARASGKWQAAGSVLDGSETERRDLVFRRVSEWLRGLGWPLQKTNHGLRSWAGGQVTIRYRLEEAQIWLRHRSITTTQSHYTSRWIGAEALRGGSAVEWARVAERIEGRG